MCLKFLKLYCYWVSKNVKILSHQCSKINSVKSKLGSSQQIKVSKKSKLWQFDQESLKFESFKSN